MLLMLKIKGKKGSSILSGHGGTVIMGGHKGKGSNIILSDGGWGGSTIISGGNIISS